MPVQNGKTFSLKFMVFLAVLLLYACSHNAASPVLSKDLPNIKQLRYTVRAKPIRHRQPLPIRSTDEDETKINEGQSSGNQTTVRTRSEQILPLIGGSTLFVLPLQRKSLPQSWCKARQFRQKVHHHGCKPVYITNSMCFGQCLSFFIPKQFHSCSSCLPKEKFVKTIQLQCADRTEPLVKSVDIVKSCNCQPCERSKTFL